MVQSISFPKEADVSGLESLYSGIHKITNMHKSLDFSNVGIPEGTYGGAITGSEKHLRQYHQTRIFVNGFGGMLTHGAGTGATTHLISANLPQNITYTLSSKWDAPLAGFGNAKMNALMQVLSGSGVGKALGAQGKLDSGIHRATTMKIWGGTEPLSLSLRIPVIDDHYNTNGSEGGISTNLSEALEFLSCLCLPSYSGDLGFYVPPPSPLNFTLKAFGKKLTLNMSRYGRIMVQLGGVLLIDNCIINKISVTYPKTETLIKHKYMSNLTGASNQTYLAPLLAEVTIDITTIEGMTAGTYSKMLWLKQQPNMGSTMLDADPLINGVKNIGNSVVNTVKNAF